ncbi:hypothetical protein [Dryocola sp. LX212]
MNNIMTISELFEIGKSYYPEGHFRVEIWDVGIRFVNSVTKNDEEVEATSFLQADLRSLTPSAVRGFLDAELR